MRIIAGMYRSRILKSPPGLVCRPAMGRTREALFSMLEARGVIWRETRVLDVFAGSGSLTFEAISRGAQAATVIERDPAVADCLRANAESLGCAEKLTCVQKDVSLFLRREMPTPFDLVFMDPPYRKEYAPQVLSLLEKGWLAQGALIACEVERELRLSPPASFKALAERRFGQTMLFIYRFQDECADTPDAQAKSPVEDEA